MMAGVPANARQGVFTVDVTGENCDIDMYIRSTLTGECLIGTAAKGCLVNQPGEAVVAGMKVTWSGDEIDGQQRIYIEQVDNYPLDIMLNSNGALCGGSVDCKTFVFPQARKSFSFET